MGIIKEYDISIIPIHIIPTLVHVIVFAILLNIQSIGGGLGLLLLLFVGLCIFKEDQNKQIYKDILYRY